MMKRLVLLLLLAAATMRAQQVVVKGSVTDRESKQPLAFCTARFLNSPAGVNADAQGNFSITCDCEGSGFLVIACLGYKSDTVLVKESILSYKVSLLPLGKTLDEVIVTGVSRATHIKESPMALVTISQKVIQGTAESNIMDAIAHHAPGLVTLKTGPNISKPFIRGLGYNRVLTLYDGVRQEGQQWGDEHGIEVDAYNIERAEVIKGPASLMYGSDALAGVVSMIPFVPTAADSSVGGKIFSEYQSNNGLVGEGLRLGYKKGSWLFALRGSVRLAKNYTNPIDGRVYNTSFRENNASVLLGYETNKGYTRVNFTWYENLQGIPDGSRDSLSRKFTKQIYETPYDNIAFRPPVSEQELNSYALSPLHQDIQHLRVYSESNYKVGGGNVDLLLALQQNARKEYNHPTDPARAGMSVKLQTVNYGFRYNAPRAFNIESSFGVNGMYQGNHNDRGTNFPIPDYQLLDVGAYVFAKWKYDKWTVSGGARYDTRSIHGEELYVRTDPANGFDVQVNIPDTAGARLQFGDFSEYYGGVSSSLGCTFAIDEHISLKTNLSRGYRAPNISEIAANGLDPGAHIVYLGNKHFVPEFSFQQDLGAVIEWKDISGSIAVFNNYMSNYIYLEQVVDANGNPLVLVPGNKTFQYQQASAQLRGGEFFLDLHPSKWSGFSFANQLAVIYGNNTSKLYRGKGLQGEYLPFIPPPHLLSAVSKEFNFNNKVINSLTMKAEVECSSAQNRYLGLYQTETPTSAYSLFNAGIDVRINYTSKNFLRLYFQVNNIFDTAWQSNLSRLKYFEYYSQSPMGRYGIYGMGRNVCVKLVVDF